MIKNYKNIIDVLDKKQKRYFILIVALSFVGMIFEILGIGLLLPTLGVVLNSDLTVNYPFLKPVLKLLGGPSQTELVRYVLYSFLIFFLVKTVYVIWLTYKQSNFAASITDRLARSLFGGYIGMPYPFHLVNNSAVLIRNIQSEVQSYTEVIRGVLVLILECFIALGIATFLFVWKPLGTSLIVGFIALTVFVFNLTTKKIVKKWGYQRQEAESKVHQHLMQGLGGVKEVKLMGKESYFLKQFHQHFHRRTFIIAKQLALVQVPRMLLEFLAVIGIVAVIFVSIAQNVELDVLLTTVGVFLAAIFRLLPSLSRIMASVQLIKFHEPAVELVKNELKEVANYHQEQATVTAFSFSQKVIISNVSFIYPSSDNYALEKVEFNIKKGECIGIIGKSGSGKSTLIDIILGLVDPLEGAVMVDGININSNIRGWQNLVGYVPQTIYLTDASIEENIAFGSSKEEINGERIKQVIKNAMLEDFIKTLPEIEKTIIGERGARISGGQRQRIGIARALYNDPELLVLDEATSALDNETEKDVMKAVTALKGTRTMVIVAHRHSTLTECDRIYEFEDGKIVRKGTPIELGLVH
tara:strand:- start:91915 stop:93666 length:1752 start_codon:yes stop_codon:yes gene_type:complete